MGLPAPKGSKMTPDQAVNIVQMLRAEPLYYRNFGPYWWHVKKQLKANGHTSAVLPHLGDFEDPDPVVAEKYDGFDDADLDIMAFEAAAENSMYRRNDPDHVDDETGETYHLYDEDVGI